MSSVTPVAIFLTLFAAVIWLALIQHRTRRAHESFIDEYVCGGGCSGSDVAVAMEDAGAAAIERFF